MNIILFAHSTQYGEVVLKLGSPGKTTLSEIEYIRTYSSECFAKCYYSNKKDRVILLEKVHPGYSLKELNSQQERVNIFCEILNKIETKPISNHSFPSYGEGIKERINLVEQNKEKYACIAHMLNTVNQFLSEIKSMNLPQYVLHDDLQHKNILKAQNSWKVIDPHGLVGEKIFDTSMFIRAESKMNDYNNLEDIVTLVSRQIKEDKKLLYKALYINSFSKIAYYIKAKYSNDLLFNELKLCEKVAEYFLKDGQAK